MSHLPTDKGSQAEPAEQLSRDRLVYLMPEGTFGRPGGEVDLRELFQVFWRRKWLMISVAATVAAASMAYALLATEWYRAEILLMPAEEGATPSIGGQLGSLAALAGVSVGADNSTEAVATLKSQEFARDFIEDFNLLPVFFPEDWDAARGRWIGEDPEQWPDVRDAVKYFHDEVLGVSQDQQTGLVILEVEWIDPEVAAAWADALVRRLNGRLRERALQEAEFNVRYLQEELGKTNIVTLQQPIGSLLESELQKVMLARGNEEFAFRVIDAPGAPKERAWPKRTLIAVLGTMLGGILALIAAFVAHILASEAEENPRGRVDLS